MKAPRMVAAGVIAAAAVLVLPAPAFAHVTVSPEGQAAKGGYATIGFKVPNERDNASTTRLEVTVPADHPLASVMPQAVNGWSVKVTRSKLDKPLELHGEKIDEAVTKVTWTADGKGIEPGYFQTFPLSVGPLPEDTDALVFKAIQTYSDKEVVRWIEAPQDGQEEPENPAPVLTLSAASEDGHHDSGAASGKNAETAAQKTAVQKTAAEAPADRSDTTARVLAVVGIAVGALGVAYGVLAGRRRTAA